MNTLFKFTLFYDNLSPPKKKKIQNISLINVKKTRYILFRNPNTHVPFNVVIGDNIIERLGENCRDKYIRFESPLWINYFRRKLWSPVCIKHKYSAHTDPILKQLNILKAEDLTNLNQCMFVHTYKSNCRPLSFKYFLTPSLPADHVLLTQS